MFDDIRDDLDYVGDVATRDFRAPKGKLFKYASVFTGCAVVCFWLNFGYFGWAFLVVAALFGWVLFRRIRRDLRNRAIGNAIEVRPASTLKPLPAKTSTGGGLKVPPPLSRDQ